MVLQDVEMTRDYPDNWIDIVQTIGVRSGWQCECTGECGLHRGKRCEERHGEDAQWASGRVCLTTAHRNHYPPDCRPENLLHLCNTCHLRYDLILHIRNAFETRRNRKAVADLFNDYPFDIYD